MSENTRKQIIINPRIMAAAKVIYKGGAFINSSDSRFLRDVLETISNKVKKAAKK